MNEFNELKKVLTLDEAYDAMIDYLAEYNKKIGYSIDIDCLFGDMLLMSDGTSVDSAALNEWFRCVDKILKQNQPNLSLSFMNSQKVLSIQEAYAIAIAYLEQYYKETHSDDIQELLVKMALQPDGPSIDHSALIEWNKFVTKILHQNPRIRPMFKFIA